MHSQFDHLSDGKANAGLLHYFLEVARKMGKKRVIFAFWPITPMQNVSRGIQGMPSESLRPGLSENDVVFVALIF